MPPSMRRWPRSSRPSRRASDPAPGDEFFFGLDLGQSSDPTALAMLKRSAILDGSGQITKDHRGKRLYRYGCGHLERYHLHTPYPEIVKQVKETLERSPQDPPPNLAIDATGVGRPVVDMFLNADIPATIYPITITGGAGEPRRDRWNSSSTAAYWVPKADLVGAVQSALSSERIKVSGQLPLAGTLKKELLNFKIKITQAGNDIYGAWRDGQHDDIVLAVALAVWLGDESDYRLHTIAGAVAVPQGRPNLVKGGIARGPVSEDPNESWNRQGRHDNLSGQSERTASNNYGLTAFRKSMRRNFHGR